MVRFKLYLLARNIAGATLGPPIASRWWMALFVYFDLLTKVLSARIPNGFSLFCNYYFGYSVHMPLSSVDKIDKIVCYFIWCVKIGTIIIYSVTQVALNSGWGFIQTGFCVPFNRFPLLLSGTRYSSLSSYSPCPAPEISYALRSSRCS